MTEFECLECKEDFEAQNPFDDVQCPHCKTKFETGFDYVNRDCAMSFWLERKVA